VKFIATEVLLRLLLLHAGPFGLFCPPAAVVHQPTTFTACGRHVLLSSEGGQPAAADGLQQRYCERYDCRRTKSVHIRTQLCCKQSGGVGSRYVLQ